MNRAILMTLCGAAAAFCQSPPLPLTGKEVPQLAAYEEALRPVLTRWNIPGAAVAITDRGRLVYARGFGYADRDAAIPVYPTSVFRLASISKTLTGMAILKLSEEGKLNLDAKFVDLIPDLAPLATPPQDPRMRQVTVRQLLQHVAGFERDLAEDWAFYFNTASRAFSQPVSLDLITRFIISQKLDFDPGLRYAYGNSAYQILGRVIERVTKQKYEDVIREKLLTPSGATGLRLGRSLADQRAVDEVRYYDYPGAPLRAPVVPGLTGQAPAPYGGFWVEMADSYGGWIGNAIDMMKYINALEGRRGTALLSAASRATIIARPAAPASGGTGNYTGLTWRIIPVTGGQHWWHSGSAPGTRTLLVRRQNERDWVVLLNSRPQDEDTIITDLFNAMAAAEARVTTWPTHDLFADFDRPVLAASAETLQFTHSAGSTPPDPQTLLLTASAGTLDFTVSQPAAAWLRLDRLAGSAPGALRVSVEPSGLEPGSYQTMFTITAAAAGNAPRYIRVTLRVTPAPQFTAMKNSASRAAVTAAAADSRLTLEDAAIGAGATASFTDSAKVELPATIVEAVDGRMDVVVPAGTAPGEAEVSVKTNRGLLIRGRILIEPFSPGLFSANGDGQGAARASVLRTREDGTMETTAAFQCGEEPGSCVPLAIDPGAESDRLELRLSATGLRAQTDPAAFAARIGEDTVEVAAVEPSPSEPGVDLVTLRLPRNLAGRGELDVTVTVGERTSNAVRILVQ